MVKILFILAGGGIGSLLRYGVSGAVSKYSPTFPWGTLAVNLAGSLAIGFLWGLSERLVFPGNWKPFIFVGILGGFTTFSSYGLECFNLLRDGEVLPALANVLLSNIAGVGLVFLGFSLSRILINCL